MALGSGGRESFEAGIGGRGEYWEVEVVDKAGDFAAAIASGGSGRTLEKRDLPLLFSSPPGVVGIDSMTRKTLENGKVCQGQGRSRKTRQRRRGRRAPLW